MSSDGNRSSADDAAGSAPAPDDELAGNGRPRILIVEDERLLLKPVASLLADEGFDVVGAADGVEALEIYRRQPRAIALVILDVHLPGLDGFQVFRRMKELDERVAVLFVSGNVVEPSRHALIASGARGYLPKPYRIETLVAKIRESLNSPGPLH